jgi:3-isopropylmalate/(R)-2-methylmalate dehydratase large subunit
MAGRMTVCNMAVELGARAALIAADEITESALQGHPHSGQFAFKGESWVSEPDAVFDKEFTLSGADIEPLITWGTSPDQSVPITGNVPSALYYASPKAKAALERSLQYMGLSEGQSAQSIKIDTAFIGSCTNSRIEDLREAAKILEGRHVAEGVEAIVVPGSAMTRIKAEAEGLRDIFEAAGFEWRPEAGCSMCLAMNDDIAMDGERVASSTNRNFEGRQGRGARTHLMSPAMVAAAAVAGHLADVRDFKRKTSR